jgi:hypothetical protein
MNNQTIVQLYSKAHQYRGKFEYELTTDRVSISTISDDDRIEIINDTNDEFYPDTDTDVILDVCGTRAVVQIEDLRRAVIAFYDR